LIDDDKGEVIVGVSTLKLEGKRAKPGGNVAAATLAGQVIAKEALGKGVETAVFDRGGYIYHGRVKALAEAAREAGLRI
jgi:large subunit ribosomal protein L18